VTSSPPAQSQAPVLEDGTERAYRRTAIRYGLLARLSDWHHGRQDGHAEIPKRPRPGATARVVSTPHRDSLIRWALGAFEKEHENLIRANLEARNSRTAAQSQQRAAQLKLTEARARLAAVSVPLSAQELAARRLGEKHHSDAAIERRRLREHAVKVAAAQAEVRRFASDVDAAQARVEAAQSQIAQNTHLAQVRAGEVHEYAHRRINRYRRHLVRLHRDGGWVNAAMSVAEPELPHWGDPVCEAPPPPQRPVTLAGTAIHVDPSVEVRPLGQRMLFGSDEPPPGEEAEFWQLPELAAPRHFLLTREGPEAFRIKNLGYGQGPFINGRPVSNAPLKPDDYFDFADDRYRISADGAELTKSPLLPAALVVSGLSAPPRLTEMSFVQREREMLAILGPSGAGKTSLFYAIVGELKLKPGGDLYFGDLSLRTHGEQIRDRLGFVPQEESLFRTLTVRRLLRYSYRLRLASRRSQDQRIEDVCAQLKIDGKLDKLVGTLSGGQRKRVSIAVEMLSKPALLMLDEPTSGLDAGMDQEVLRILRDYAREEDGRTVIVITHSTEHLGLARHVLVVAGEGQPVYFGPPDAVLSGLNAASFTDLMNALTSADGKEARQAAARYAEGPQVIEARQAASDVEARTATAARAAGRPPRLRIGLRQLRVLVERQVALLLTRGATSWSRNASLLRRLGGAGSALLPLIIAIGGALLASLVSGADGLGVGRGHQGSLTASAALSLLITLCMLCGQALTYSDIVNDYPSIHREHRTGVLTLPVLTAKWLVFAAVAALQAAIITTIFLCCRPAPVYGEYLGPVAGLFADLIAMTVAAMTLGLLISACTGKLEQAIGVATVASIAQIALNGVASNLSHDRFANFLSMLLPARWGLAATAASVNLRAISPAANQEALWRHSIGQWAFDLSMLGVLTMANFLLARWLLARRLRRMD
jgi:ABC transport system ATP-binding/permease protein